MSELDTPHELPKLPRGATWYVLRVLPVLVLPLVLLVPWSDKPAAVFDGEKMKIAAERWQRGMAARRQAASAPEVSTPGTVTVRLLPAASAASR